MIRIIKRFCLTWRLSYRLHVSDPGSRVEGVEGDGGGIDKKKIGGKEDHLPYHLPYTTAPDRVGGV